MVTLRNNPGARLAETRQEVRNANNLEDADTASYDGVRSIFIHTRGSPPLTENKVPNIPAANYVHVSRKHSAAGGQYLLDLSLARAPQSLWGPIPYVDSDTPANNLTLRTTSGNITTEIWIIHNGGETLSRASLVLCSDNGCIHAKVVRIPNPRHPLFEYCTHTAYSMCLSPLKAEADNDHRFT